jgi:hypothetical protein
VDLAEVGLGRGNFYDLELALRAEVNYCTILSMFRADARATTALRCALISAIVVVGLFTALTTLNIDLIYI